MNLLPIITIWETTIIVWHTRLVNSMTFAKVVVLDIEYLIYLMCLSLRCSVKAALGDTYGTAVASSEVANFGKFAFCNYMHLQHEGTHKLNCRPNLTFVLNL